MVPCNMRRDYMCTIILRLLLCDMCRGNAQHLPSVCVSHCSHCKLQLAKRVSATVVQRDASGHVHSQHHIIKSLSPCWDKHKLLHLLESAHWTGQLHALGSGTAIPSLMLTSLRLPLVGAPGHHLALGVLLACQQVLCACSSSNKRSAGGNV